MRSLALLALASLLLVQVVSATSTFGTTSDACALKSITVTSASGTLNLSPTFVSTTAAYTLNVPYGTTWIQVQAIAASWSSGLLQVGYFNSSGGTCANPSTCTQTGAYQAPGHMSNEIDLNVGVNFVQIKSACSCADTYTICITRASNSGVKGDPIFGGLLGQQFQVHGVAGEIYNIISDPVMQMNSRFVFLNHGDCPILNGRKAHACWSHPGSYLGELGIKTCGGDKVLIQSGAAKKGFKTVSINGQELELDEVYDLNCDLSLPANDSALVTTTLSSNGIEGGIEGDADFLANTTESHPGWIVRNSTHLVTVQLSNFLLEIENSDMFVNYRVKVLNWAALPGTHGLLGQTYRKPLKPGKQIKEIEGHVDEYQIHNHDLWGDQFVYNRFGVSK